MASLMDRINKGMTAQPTQTQGPGQSQIEKVLKAKGGKAGAGAGVPAASGLQAETAQQQAQDQLKAGSLQGALAGAQMKQQSEQIAAKETLGKQELASKGRMAREGMQAESKMAAAQRQARAEDARTKRTAEENMKLDQLEASSTQRLRELATQREVSLDNIFGDFERSNKELAFRRDAAELEQMGFDLAMSDRAYLDELNRVGRERMLTNDLQFAEESARITLGDQLQDTMSSIDFIQAFNGDRRAWEQKLGTLKLDDAMQLIKMEMEGANQRAFVEGLGTAGVKGHEYGKKKEWW